MKQQGPRPRVKRGDQAGLGPEVFLISQQLKESVPGAVKQQTTENLSIQPPQRVQFIGNRKDHMKMITTQKAGLLFLKPAFHLNEGALRTHPVFARIIPMTLHMTVRTGLHVTSQRCRSASDQRLGGLLNMLG